MQTLYFCKLKCYGQQCVIIIVCKWARSGIDQSDHCICICTFDKYKLQEPSKASVALRNQCFVSDLELHVQNQPITLSFSSIQFIWEYYLIYMACEFDKFGDIIYHICWKCWEESVSKDIFQIKPVVYVNLIKEYVSQYFVSDLC